MSPRAESIHYARAMKVLIGCEESGAVRDAFIRGGMTPCPAT